MIEEKTIRKLYDIYHRQRDRKENGSQVYKKAQKKKNQPTIAKDQTLVEVDGIKEVLDYLCHLRAIKKKPWNLCKLYKYRAWKWNFKIL